LIDAFLAVSALAAVLGLAALLAAGARLERSGLGWTAGWAAVVCVGAALAGHAMLSLGTAEVSVAGAVVAIAILAVGRLERDWNPLAQAALATTARAVWRFCSRRPCTCSARRWVLRRTPSERCCSACRR
jgi:hypothetical protein